MLNYIINLVHNFGGKRCDSTTQADLIVYRYSKSYVNVYLYLCVFLSLYIFIYIYILWFYFAIYSESYKGK